MKRLLCMAACLAGLTSGALAAPDEDGPRVQVFSTQTRGSYIGVWVAEVTPERAKALSLKELRGVELTGIEDGSPAATAGLKKGDVVLEYNGQPVEGTEQFMRLVRETPVGRDVRLTVHRSGATQNVIVRTAARKGPRAPEGFQFDMPQFKTREFRFPDAEAFSFFGGPRLGIDADPVSGQLAEFFGVSRGVLVRSVQKGSAAEKAGMKAGDVIIKIEDRAVEDSGDVRSAMRTAAESGKKAVSITIVRDRREQTITAAVDSDGEGSEHVRGPQGNLGRELRRSLRGAAQI